MKRISAIIYCLAASFSWGQDIHFTQAQEVPMLINPAATGMFNGWERVAVNHKNQWVNAGTKFFTTSIAADMNFFKPKRGDKAHMGIGIQFYNDIGGDSKFGTKQFLMNFSAIVPLNEMNELSTGLQVGIGQRTGDLTGIIFPNQFNGEVLDPSINSMEYNNLVSFMYPDVSAGIMYRYGNHKIGFHRDDFTDFRIGFSYQHINRPSLKYRLGGAERLYSKFVIHTSFMKDFSGSKLGMETYFIQFIQGPHNETSFGAILRYRVQDGGKSTGLSRDIHLNGGIGYRWKDAISPILFFEYASFKFGLSYDIVVSKFSAVSRAGGLEFSLQYANLDFAMFKRRRR
ncbi:MAG: PorP/SprF family type IX secretion system membrane protein [Crocinitomicaceae bacterium]|nr:PorP/SprF family type IX secretion system membrane protein [Crocinitomicaceae bacterium]